MNVIYLLCRNGRSRRGVKLPRGRVALEYFDDELNLGDHLSRVIYEYMLSREGLSANSPSVDGKIKHLMAVGSILGGRGDFNATVWGSGIRTLASIRALTMKKFYQKLDVRAVRGPLTRDTLVSCGFSCPDIYGDPAVLMPLVYTPKVRERKGIVYVAHYRTERQNAPCVRHLDISTSDYKTFLDELTSAEKVVSSSLHGIILAEAYGVPVVFLKNGMESSLIKYYDWYYSTGRYNVRMASSLEQAIKMEAMPLPNLEGMRTQLLKSFPYDMWKRA